MLVNGNKLDIPKADNKNVFARSVSLYDEYYTYLVFELMYKYVFNLNCSPSTRRFDKEKGVF